ncbi:MAG: hypothetical protein QW275_01590 [Candidatus Anstonellaceae archaeon]
MQNYPYPKPSKAVCINADGNRIGTLARRKITSFRKFLLDSDAYPEEVRKEWSEHRNKEQESLLMAYIRECDRVSQIIKKELDYLQPTLEKKDSEIKQLYLEISKLGSKIEGLKKIQNKSLETAKQRFVSSHGAKEKEKALLAEIEIEAKRFSNIDSTIKLMEDMLISSNQNSAEIANELKSAFAPFISDEDANSLKEKLAGVSRESGEELSKIARRLFMDMQPEYALIFISKNLLKNNSPFSLFSWHAKRECLEIDNAEEIARTKLSSLDRLKAEDICNMVIMQEKKMGASLTELRQFISKAEQKVAIQESILEGIFSNRAGVYLGTSIEDAQELSLEAKITFVSKLTENTNSLKRAIGLAKRVESFFKTDCIPQMYAIKAVSRYLHLYNEIALLEDKQASFQMLDSSQDYWKIKYRYDSLSYKLKEISNAKEKAKLSLHKLAQKRYAQEQQMKIRKESAEFRLNAYLMKLDMEEQAQNQSQNPTTFSFQKENNSASSKETQSEELCWRFVSAAKEQFKDFLKSYPQLSEAFEKTLFNLGKIFIQSGGRLDRNKLTSFFQGRVRQEHFPNSNAVIVRLGMVGSNEFRFLIDTTDSLQPIILMAGIKEESRRFLKRILQGGYSSERAKALNDGRGSLFSILQNNGSDSF